MTYPNTEDIYTKSWEIGSRRYVLEDPWLDGRMKAGPRVSTLIECVKKGTYQGISRNVFIFLSSNSKLLQPSLSMPKNTIFISHLSLFHLP